MKIFIRVNEILTDIYLCKVCQTPLKHDRMDIEAHLKTAHKITFRVYEVNFESGQVFKEGDNLWERTIDLLVSKRQMEESRGKVFKAPIKMQKMKGCQRRARE